jgi:hypothetical protein
MDFNEAASAAAVTMTTSRILEKPAVLRETFVNMVGEVKNLAMARLFVKPDAVSEWKRLADHALEPMTPSQLLEVLGEYDRPANEEESATFTKHLAAERERQQNILIRKEIASVAEKNPQIAKHLKYWNVRSEGPDLGFEGLFGPRDKIINNLRNALAAAIAEGDSPPSKSGAGAQPSPN